MRARVVLWSTPGLASMKHSAISPSGIVAAFFSSTPGIQFFSGIYSSTRANPGYV